MSWNEAKRIEAVTTYLILGNLTLTAQTIGVPHVTLKLWHRQPWWKEMEVAIQVESDQELDGKLAKRIDKCLEVVNDRLENGDFQYDPKTGQFVRKPVSLRDGWKVASEAIDKRWLIRKQPKEVANQEAVGDILKNLAQEFADMAKKRVRSALGETDVSPRSESVEAILDSQLQGGIPELPRETGTNSEPFKPEQGT